MSLEIFLSLASLVVARPWEISEKLVTHSVVDRSTNPMTAWRFDHLAMVLLQSEDCGTERKLNTAQKEHS